MGLGIAEILHPKYIEQVQEWQKWRLAYISGAQFIRTYLKQFTRRETNDDFAIRSDISYCPSFAKAAINDVKNSIYQRMSDITRIGGTGSFLNCINGSNNGVDLLGSSMTYFIGQRVLPELLVMGKVGVFVDMPPLPGEVSLAQTKNIRPYIYTYEAEDIRSWALDHSSSPNEYTTLLLRDFIYEYDDITGLPVGEITRFRHFWLNANHKVMMQLYNEQGNAINYVGDEISAPVELNIERIPFVVLELSDSLMSDVANYQIALLNLASSDIMYSLKANFPFYVEQWDPKTESAYLRTPSNVTGGESADANTGKQPEIKVGVAQGRRYPVGTAQPAFIHPSAEPLKASMEKQLQLKEEIRLLVNLAISNLQPKVSSAESKGFDERSLEAGLSTIGLELEQGERKIAEFWAAYERVESAVIKYPEKYNLKTDEERRKDADETGKLIPIVPSKTYQKEMAKKIARIMLENSLEPETILKIHKEIDEAPNITSDPQSVQIDLEGGLVDRETASKVRGYPPGTAEKAKTEYAERLKLIAESQTPGKGMGAAVNNGARGNKDGSPTPKTDAKAEKTSSQSSANDAIPQTKTRGPGKNNDKFS